MVRIGMLRAANMSITASQVCPMDAATSVASRGVGAAGGTVGLGAAHAGDRTAQATRPILAYGRGLGGECGDDMGVLGRAAWRVPQCGQPGQTTGLARLAPHGEFLDPLEGRILEADAGYSWPGGGFGLMYLPLAGRASARMRQVGQSGSAPVPGTIHS